MIYEAFLPIAHQLVIYKHDIEYYGKAPVRAVDANGFPCQALLREIWPGNNVDFSFSSISQTKNRAIKAVYQLLKRQKNLDMKLLY